MQMGGIFPADMGVFINSPGFIGIYSGFQNLKFLADICGKIGEKEIREAMSKVGLDPDNKTKVDNYSLGMKQKLGLAQAIMERQDILVLDEPFNALDYKTYEDVKIIIRMLKAEGKTIFMTSHRYKDIEQLCDQVYSLENCRLVPINGPNCSAVSQRWSNRIETPGDGQETAADLGVFFSPFKYIFSKISYICNNIQTMFWRDCFQPLKPLTSVVKRCYCKL